MTSIKFPLTWILTADAGKATVWEWSSKPGPLTPVPDFNLIAEDTRGFARDLKSDRPGRSFASVGARRSAMEPPNDPHDLAKARFMKQISDSLESAARDRRFSQLVIMAPPQMLGVLRQELSDTVRRTIATEIDKDLTKADPAQILSQARASIQ